MSDSLIEIVQRRLADLERVEDVVVCLAVESGSRAWGFPSRDSDFDVRFVYVHRPEWYLSIDLEERRDVIERPIEDEIQRLEQKADVGASAFPGIEDLNRLFRETLGEVWGAKEE